MWVAEKRTMLSLFLFFLATSEASQLPGYGGSVPGGYGGGGAYGWGGQYGGAYGGGPAYGGGSTYGGGGPYGGGKGYGGGFGLGAVGGYPGGGYPGGFPGGAKGGIYQTGGAAFGPGGAYGVAGGYGPYATGGGNPLLAEALYGNRHNYVAGGNLNLGHGGIKSPLNVITQAAYQNNFAPLQNYGYGGFGGLQPYGADEINKFRHKKGLHALDEDDLDADGKPDHLVATKYKIDDYLAKQWHLGRRKLTVNVQSSTVPLEYQYLQQYHGFAHPLAGLPVGQSGYSPDPNTYNNPNRQAFTTQFNAPKKQYGGNSKYGGSQQSHYGGGGSYQQKPQQYGPQYGGGGAGHQQYGGAGHQQYGSGGDHQQHGGHQFQNAGPPQQHYQPPYQQHHQEQQYQPVQDQHAADNYTPPASSDQSNDNDQYQSGGNSGQQQRHPIQPDVQSRPTASNQPNYETTK